MKGLRKKINPSLKQHLTRFTLKPLLVFIRSDMRRSIVYSSLWLLLVVTQRCFASSQAEVPLDGPGGDASQARLKRDVDLGKRITSNLVAELGKRPREMYSFGIGKRSISDEEMAEFMAENEAAEARLKSEEETKPEAEEESSEEELSADKRNPYSFGLGKKRASIGNEYGFGLGKRNPYAFGLGKRIQAPMQLGKKDDPIYAFGLGKRNPYAFGLGKRNPYAFGLGKRNPYAFGLGKKRDPYAFGLGKRDPYSFGLGK